MYDRKLIDYLPNSEKTFKEFNAIMTDAEDPEMSMIWGASEDVLNDQFIQDATENGISRLEKIIGIIPKATETLDARRFTILLKNNEQPPFTITALKKQLETLCGEDNYEVTRDVASKVLSVKVALTAKNNYNDVEKLLERVVPANMVIDLSLKYNKHNVIATRTHKQLQNFTHEQLRNEVF